MWRATVSRRSSRHVGVAPLGWSAGGYAELVEEVADTAFDLVPDRTDVVDILAGRVVEIPVEVTLAGKDRAGVAAAHRDDHIGGADDLVSPRLRELGRDVDASFGHRGHGGRVDADTRFGTTGPTHRPIIGEVLEETQRHLATAGVVHTQEQHHRAAVVTVALDLRQRLQTLPGEAFRDQR